MPDCRPPKGVSVREYTRAGPRRKAKQKPPAVYYECQSASGHWCGVKHRSRPAAYSHTVALNKQVRRTSRKTREGRQDLYVVEKRTS